LLIDKSELSALIIGGDWNCSLTKKEKKGGLPWKSTAFANSIKITMDVFDLALLVFKEPNTRIMSTSIHMKL